MFNCLEWLKRNGGWVIVNGIKFDYPPRSDVIYTLIFTTQDNPEA
jgi:hypothetical protein